MEEGKEGQGSKEGFTLIILADGFTINSPKKFYLFLIEYYEVSTVSGADPSSGTSRACLQSLQSS